MATLLISARQRHYPAIDRARRKAQGPKALRRGARPFNKKGSWLSTTLRRTNHDKTDRSQSQLGAQEQIQPRAAEQSEKSTSSVGEVFVLLNQNSEIFKKIMELDRDRVGGAQGRGDTFTRLSCEGQSFDVIPFPPFVTLDHGCCFFFHVCLHTNKRGPWSAGEVEKIEVRT